MDHYLLWVDLKDSHRDLEFTEHVREYMAHLKERGHLVGYTLTRRKLGFGPKDLGEFQIDIQTRDMAQLESMFQYVATRGAPVEPLYRAVYGMVSGFDSALFRDFPDTVRVAKP